MNIYKLEKDGGDHIGKRWANGVWCWTCRVRAERLDKDWQCPTCHEKKSSDQLSFNPAYRELGFDKSEEVPNKRGVDGASGFHWHAKDRQDAVEKLKGIKTVKTEYGESWPIKRFWRMFHDVIEEDFYDSDFS